MVVVVVGVGVVVVVVFCDNKATQARIGIWDLGFWDLVWLGLGVAISKTFEQSCKCRHLKLS